MIKPESTTIPEETQRVARAAFPSGNRYMRMRDALGAVYSDEQFADLFSTLGQPAESPGRIALVTVMQFAEGLSDRQAADAVRARIDWKYALGLALTDTGFDYSVLSEFRTRLIAGQAEQALLETMLTVFKAEGLIKVRGKQRTDSTHVLAAVHVLNRLECVCETMRHALETLAVVAPDWLRGWAPTSWFERYAQRFEEYRLPAGREERHQLAEQIGADGFQLLHTLYESASVKWLYEVPAVQILRRVWIQQFSRSDQVVTWRATEDVPPAALYISSPHDIEARYSQKRSTEWTGYKVHLTETCDEDTPHLITDVETTAATTSDYVMTPLIQDQLAQHELLPEEHLVDAGYVSADHLVTSQSQHAIDLIAPAPVDPSWQAKAAQGFDHSHFAIDWDEEQATCPQGHVSALWMPSHDHVVQAKISVRFARQDCQDCPTRALCTHSPEQPRMLVIRPRPSYEALQTARQRATTSEFKKKYNARAGIEGTLSQAIRMADLRRARYIGLAKTHLQHVLTAAAINLARVADWLAEVPRALTRRSHFAALSPS
jgi:transposase